MPTLPYRKYSVCFLRTISLSAAIVTAFTAPIVARADGAESADLHGQVDAIFAPWNGADTPGCAVGVLRDGALDYARGYGMANLESGVSITVDSVFHAASISKQFTAFAIGLLAQDGKLSLDDDIRQYLPELPDYGTKVTIAHLLHHTSGLREQGQVLTLAGWRSDDVKTQDDMLWIVAKQRKLNFEPGSEVSYTNTGYMLAATIVERVSGEPFPTFTEERIFKPLGMTATRFVDDHTEIVPRRSSAYSPRDDGGWRINVPTFEHYGSTNLSTTVGDLVKWQQNLFDGRVGGRELVDSLQTPSRLNDGTEIAYGGGLFLRKYRGLRTVGHNGLDGAYRADAVAFPDQRLAVAALCNDGSITPATLTELTRKVGDVYLRDRLSPAALPPVALPAAVAMPDAEQSALAGVYWSRLSDEIVRLEWKDGALRQVGSSTAFVPIGGGGFRPDDSAHEWRFSTPAPGAPRELSIIDYWPPTARVFEHIDEPLPSVSAMRAFAGRYRSDETDMTYAVDLTDGKLSLRWPRQFDIALEPIGGDRFLGSVGLVTFTRDARGEVDGFTISTRRLRRFAAQRL